MKRPSLTPTLHGQIVAAIRAGSYPHVAAGAFGVSPSLLETWLEKGAAPRSRGRHAVFAEAVRTAVAQARLRAEIAVFENEPRSWLEHGLGRESQRSPGWSSAVRPGELESEARNLLLDPKLMALFGAVLKALGAFPDARAQITTLAHAHGLKVEQSTSGKSAI